MFNLDKTPYLLSEDSEKQIKLRLEMIEERVFLLRRNGELNDDTVKNYYGLKRFEQVAESNAIEGSTLSVGETELAVLKGVTITGHDPAYVKDAIALDNALNRLTELAKDKNSVTNISQLHEIHSLLLGDRSGAGMFRNERVFIRGSKHTPPKTWKEIMTQMEEWEKWSIENATLPAPIRAAILHAWLAHIHPYIDGNGRTARAISNLEFIRTGYPPIIIKKKERDRYIESLAESDEGGDIRSFIELIFDRVEGALTGLELSAKQMQGFNPIIEKIRMKQENQLKIWETSIQLLASIIEHQLSTSLEAVNGSCFVKIYESTLELDDYIGVCNGHSVPRSWAFIISLQVPGIPKIEKLAYVGHRSNHMYNAMNQEGGPSLYWSSKNPNGFPKWLSDGSNSPFAIELTTKIGIGDDWYALKHNNQMTPISTTELAKKISEALIDEAMS